MLNSSEIFEQFVLENHFYFKRTPSKIASEQASIENPSSAITLTNIKTDENSDLMTQVCISVKFNQVHFDTNKKLGLSSNFKNLTINDS